MRSLRNALAFACLMAAPAAQAAAPSPGQLVGLSPVLKGVEYELVPNEAVAGCKVVTVKIGERAAGYALRDGQGKMLRRFVNGSGKVDKDGKSHMDQWSYYQDGFEVYRETDLDGDGRPDECRWLNAGGTRVAMLGSAEGKGLTITAWKRLSAEEASKVFVQALVSGNAELLGTVLAQPEELKELGLPAATITQVADAATKRTEAILALRKSVIGLGWNNATVWNRLDGLMPHLIPADPGSGLKQDLLLYENAVIFAGPPAGQTNNGKMGFLQALEMIKLGDTWKFIEMPRAIDPEKPIVAMEGILRSALVQGPGPNVDPDGPPAFVEAKRQLTKYTTESAHLLTDGKKEDVASYHVKIVQFLNQCAKTAPDPEQKLAFRKQIIDSIAAAYQTGLYPKGRDFLLKNFIDDGGELASNAAYSLLSAEFSRKNEESPNDLLANQKKWMDELKSFIAKYPAGEKTPDAYYSLAAGNEFLAEEDEARKYYTELKEKFPDSETGKKAAGSLRRLDLVGKSLDLKGMGLDGQPVDSSQYKGKAVLITFWASWADPVKRDLPELLKVYEKNKSRGFAIVGISLDSDRKELEAFLKEHKLPWPEIFEEGGMESRLAVEYGIISLPTMILVDPEGRVANRNIRTASEVEKQLDKILPTKQGGVALGDK